VYYLTKPKENKKGLQEQHFPFGSMKHLDNSERFDTHSFRSTWYELPYLESKTLDPDTNEPINLSQKPLAEGERLVSLF
jgi:hypothetical protein